MQTKRKTHARNAMSKLPYNEDITHKLVNKEDTKEKNAANEQTFLAVRCKNSEKTQAMNASLKA